MKHIFFISLVLFKFTAAQDWRIVPNDPYDRPWRSKNIPLVRRLYFYIYSFFLIIINNLTFDKMDGDDYYYDDDFYFSEDDDGKSPPKVCLTNH